MIVLYIILLYDIIITIIIIIIVINIFILVIYIYIYIMVPGPTMRILQGFSAVSIRNMLQIIPLDSAFISCWDMVFLYIYTYIFT